MNAKEMILRVAGAERNRLFSVGDENPAVTLRRPDPRDETDRIGRELAKRLLEAGVCEIL